MDCKKFEERLVAAVDNKYLLESDPELNKHLEQCPDCKALFAELVLENEYLIDAGSSFEVPSGLDEKIIANLPVLPEKRSIPAYRWLVYAAA